MKKTMMFCAVLILTLWVGRVYFHPGFPYTHDGENHLARFANYKLAVKEGHIPPRWAPNLLNHYGYPVFNYNYPLANILSLPGSILKINYETTFKILALGFIALGLTGMIWWLRSGHFSRGPLAIGVLMFATSPYLHSLIVIRGNIGELAALGLFPWLLYSIERFKQFEIRPLEICLWSLIWSAFALSHNVTVLYGGVVLCLVAAARWSVDTKSWKRGIATGLIALMVSMWFWVPALLEKKYIVLDQAALSQEYTKHFSTLTQLLVAPLTFGFSFSGPVDSFSISIGVAQVIALAAFGLSCFKYSWWRNHKRRLTLFLGLLVIILLQLEFSKFIWQVVPLARFIQFPWRLGLILTVFIPLLSAYVSHSQRIRRILMVVLVVQLLALSRVKPADYFSKNILDYDLFSQTTSTAHENMPVGFRYEQFGQWQPGPESIEGTATIQVSRWAGLQHQFSIDAATSVLVVEPVAYYPGWETVVKLQDGSVIKQKYYDDTRVAGRVAYWIDPGKYDIVTTFTQNTPARRLGNSISLVGFCCMVFLVVLDLYGGKKARL